MSRGRNNSMSHRLSGHPCDTGGRSLWLSGNRFLWNPLRVAGLWCRLLRSANQHAPIASRHSTTRSQHAPTRNQYASTMNPFAPTANQHSPTMNPLGKTKVPAYPFSPGLRHPSGHLRPSGRSLPSSRPRSFRPEVPQHSSLQHSWHHFPEPPHQQP